MSYCLLKVVENYFRFYYAIAEPIKDSRDVVFTVFKSLWSLLFSWIHVLSSHQLWANLLHSSQPLPN